MSTPKEMIQWAKEELAFLERRRHATNDSRQRLYCEGGIHTMRNYLIQFDPGGSEKKED